MPIEKLYSLIRKKLGIEDYVKKETRVSRNKLKEEILSDLKDQIKGDLEIFSNQLKEIMNQRLQSGFPVNEENYSQEMSRKLWELYNTLDVLENQLDRLSRL